MADKLSQTPVDTKGLPEVPKAVIDDPVMPPKKSPVIWVVVLVLILFIIGGGVVYYFRQSQNNIVTTPTVSSESIGVKPSQGLGSITQEVPTPTMTQSDTTADIEKDLNGVSIGTDEASFTEINTDLQTL